MRKAFNLICFASGCTVLFGAYAQSLEMALFWNVLSLSLSLLAGGVAASLSDWLLHVSSNCDLPMMAILGFLVVGAVATVVLHRAQWVPKASGTKASLRRREKSISASNGWKPQRQVMLLLAGSKPP